MLAYFQLCSGEHGLPACRLCLSTRPCIAVQPLPLQTLFLGPPYGVLDALPLHRSIHSPLTRSPSLPTLPPTHPPLPLLPRQRTTTGGGAPTSPAAPPPSTSSSTPSSTSTPSWTSPSWCPHSCTLVSGGLPVVWTAGAPGGWRRGAYPSSLCPPTHPVTQLPLSQLPSPTGYMTIVSATFFCLTGTIGFCECLMDRLRIRSHRSAAPDQTCACLCLLVTPLLPCRYRRCHVHLHPQDLCR